MDDLDAVEGDAEAVADQHGPAGVVALAVGARARAHQDGGVGSQLHGPVLGSGDPGRAVEEGGHPEAQLETVAVTAPAGLLRTNGVEADLGEGPVEAGLVVAAVVGLTGGGEVGEVVGHEQVAPTDLDGVETESGGEDVDRSLDGGRRLRPAGTAVGSGAAWWS